jgi:hypothetical protein
MTRSRGRHCGGGGGRASALQLLRQHWYVCTSKASNPRRELAAISTSVCHEHHKNSQRQAVGVSIGTFVPVTQVNWSTCRHQHVVRHEHHKQPKAGGRVRHCTQLVRCSVHLFYWYKSTNTAPRASRIAKGRRKGKPRHAAPRLRCVFVLLH